MENLTKAGVDINKVSREALAEAGSMLQSAMLSRVPIKNGNLASHIKIKTPTAEGNYNYCEVGIIYDLAYTDKKTSIQARAIEFGTIYAPAQPFIRPAIRALRGAITGLILSRLQAAELVD
jgi:HK97 gp10 family phage protein